MLRSTSTLSHVASNLHKSTLSSRFKWLCLLCLIASLPAFPAFASRPCDGGRSLPLDRTILDRPIADQASFYTVEIPRANPEHIALLVVEARDLSDPRNTIELDLFTADCQLSRDETGFVHFQGRLVRVVQPGTYHLALRLALSAMGSEPTVRIDAWLAHASSSPGLAGGRIILIDEDPEPPREPLDEWDGVREPITTASTVENMPAITAWTEIPGHGLLELWTASDGLKQRFFSWCPVESTSPRFVSTFTCARRLQVERSTTVVLARADIELASLELVDGTWMVADIELFLFDAQGRYLQPVDAHQPVRLAAGSYFLGFAAVTSPEAVVAFELD